MANIGKFIRLSKMFNSDSKKIVIVPLDDSLLAGPEDGLYDLKKIFKQVIAGEADAVMGFHGLFKLVYKDLDKISGILNLTASTTRGMHTRKVLVSNVEEAVKLGMDCVGVHVNISSSYETEMLKILGDISIECETLGIPLMGIMYPRGEKEGLDNNYEKIFEEEPDKYTELVRHCVRIGVELGADIIKTQYTGSVESFRTVIESSADVPVVIAGGTKINAQRMFNRAFEAMQAGAAGVSFGRNVFNRKNSSKFIGALRKIIHENASIEDAMNCYKIKPEDIN